MNIEAGKQLKGLLLDSGAYNADKHFVYFDRIWHHPARLSTCAELIYQFLLEQVHPHIPADRSQLVLLSPDAIRSNFGIIPVSVLVAAKLGCRFAVWKEMANLNWGTSAIMGSDVPDLYCIALQDVVSRGHTAVRMAQSIKSRGWQFPLYFCAVLNNRDGPELVRRNLSKIEPILGQVPQFHYILSASDLS
jgi:phosphoribosylpyrophosphate synthetase